MEPLRQMVLAPALLLRSSSCRGSVSVLGDGELVGSLLSSDADGHLSFYVVTTLLGVLQQLRWLNQGNCTVHVLG